MTASHRRASDGETDVVSKLELQYEIEQFLYFEAALLDEWRYREWFDLLSDDVHYRAPVRKNRLRRQRDDYMPRGERLEMAHFDDDKASMDLRIRQKETGKHWAEEPPSRTRHLVANVRVSTVRGDAETFDVRSNFLVYRNRLEAEVDVWAGERFDVLRRKDSDFEITRRTVLLDQNVILSKNLSVFF